MAYKYTRDGRKKGARDSTAHRRGGAGSVVPLDLDAIDYELPQRLGGALSNKLLMDRERVLFEQQFDAAVDMMLVQVERALDDRVTAVETADSVVSYPPGGRAVFPFYTKFAANIMRIARGDSASIAPIVFDDNRADWEAYMRDPRNILQLVDAIPPNQTTIKNASRALMAWYSPGIAFVTHNNSQLSSMNASRALILPNDLGLPDFYCPAVQVYPFVPEMWSSGIKDHRFVKPRRLAIDAAIRQNRTTMTGLQFKPSDLALYNITRALSVLYAPLHYLNPETGETNITGVASNSFTWESILNGTIPRICSVYFVIHSPDTESNFDFTGMAARDDAWGQNAPQVDTSHFTLKISNGVAENIGWGDLRPERVKGIRYVRTWSHQLGDRTPYYFIVSPTEEFASFFATDTPKYTSIGAVLIVSGAALAFLLYDIIATGYVRRVILSSVQQHNAKTERMWAISAKQMFASTICTEMSGPASALCGAIDMLRSTGLNPVQLEILSTLSGSATVVLALVQDATNTYTGDVVDQQFELHVTHNVDLRASVLGQSLRILRLQDRLSRKMDQVAVQTTATPMVPMTVSIDVDRIRTCVMDLIGMAVDRATAGTAVTVAADYRAQSRHLVITVAFVGQRITDEEYLILYPPPTASMGKRRNGAAATTLREGPGISCLRLVLVRDILRALGGDLTVERTAEGAKFVAHVAVINPVWRGGAGELVLGGAGRRRRGILKSRLLPATAVQESDEECDEDGGSRPHVLLAAGGATMPFSAPRGVASLPPSWSSADPLDPPTFISAASAGRTMSSGSDAPDPSLLFDGPQKAVPIRSLEESERFPSEEVVVSIQSGSKPHGAPSNGAASGQGPPPTLPPLLSSEADSGLFGSEINGGGGAHQQRQSLVRVIVGDDDDLSRKVVAMLLKIASAECEVHADGLAVSARIAADPSSPDIILCDSDMGGGDLDGAATLRRAEQLYEQLGRTAPILALMSSAPLPASQLHAGKRDSSGVEMPLAGLKEDAVFDNPSHRGSSGSWAQRQTLSFRETDTSDSVWASTGAHLQQGESVRVLRPNRAGSGSLTGAGPPAAGGCGGAGGEPISSRWILVPKPVTLEAAQALVYSAWVARRRRAVPGGGAQEGGVRLPPAEYQALA